MVPQDLSTESSQEPSEVAKEDGSSATTSLHQPVDSEKAALVSLEKQKLQLEMELLTLKMENEKIKNSLYLAIFDVTD